MDMTDGELIIKQTEKAVKHAIISEIRNEINIGVTLEVTEYLDGLIDRLINLKI